MVAAVAQDEVTPHGQLLGSGLLDGLQPVSRAITSENNYFGGTHFHILVEGTNTKFRKK